MALTAGTRLGPYEILAPLGAGGMGEVYRARDTRLGREVALKVLPEHLMSQEDRARFMREAKMISSLNHPHICVLHDVGREGDTDYLVMELVEGETLAHRISRGPLPTQDVLRIGIQIADALARAHRAGVVHRDLKPGNVMLTRSGAKLMDFGLAREAGHAAGGADLVTVTESEGPPRLEESITKKGTIVGTFQYMAPEQLEGKRPDVRSDNWALGCVLYEMATGKRAFEGTTPVSVISAIMRDQPRGMAELAPLTPPAFEQVVRQCLAKDPDDRIQTAHDVKLQLAWIAEAGSRAGIAIPVAAKRRNRERIVWGSAVAFLLLGAALAFGQWRANHERAEPFTFVPLTYKPMTIFRAAFAPDGATVAFSAATDGYTPRVFVVRPEYPEPQPVTDPGTHLLSVSSKGELALLTNATYLNFPAFGGTLARMPLGGGSPREILTHVWDADWSPDGSELAVMHNTFSGIRLEFPIGHVLYTANKGYLSDPCFSPRGDEIAFFDHPGLWDRGGSVIIVDVRGKHRIIAAGCSELTGIAWKPDGSEVLFSAVRSGSEEAVFAATRNGNVRTLLESPGGQRLHDISHNGRWLTTRDDERSAVMVHKPEWAGDRDLSWLGSSSGGQLSRDGKTIVFNESSGPSGGEDAVCLRKIDGSPVVRIGAGYLCGLSPDGKWVLTRPGSPANNLVLLPTGAGEPKRLARGIIETYNHAWWFPSGDSILIRAQERGLFRLYVQSLAGGLPRPLSMEGVYQAAIAPDGSWVVVKGTIGCFMYTSDGGEPRQVKWLGPKDELLPWVVDNRSVLVIVGPWRSLSFHIEKVDIATGRRTTFREIPPTKQSGLLECNLTDFSSDFGSYAYDATSVLSSLFLAKPKGRIP